MLRNEATPNVAAGLNAVLRSFALPNNRAFVACYPLPIARGESFIATGAGRTGPVGRGT